MVTKDYYDTVPLTVRLKQTCSKAISSINVCETQLRILNDDSVVEPVTLARTLNQSWKFYTYEQRKTFHLFVGRKIQNKKYITPKMKEIALVKINCAPFKDLHLKLKKSKEKWR